MQPIFRLLLSSLVLFGLFIQCSSPNRTSANMTTITDNTYVELSRDLIEAARYDKPHEQLLQRLAELPRQELADSLDTDAERLAFWTNVYNAHIQFFLKEHPEWYEDRGAFFKADRIEVAGKILSFDKIEHGLIRRSKVKWSLGFLPKLFTNKFEKQFRVDEVDPRIHFALNCGAKDCPPVANYSATKLDAQLEASTKRYLNNNSDYLPEENKVRVTSLMNWFRADFGDRIEFLKRYDVIPEDAEPSLDYRTYDWTLALDNYIDLNV